MKEIYDKLWKLAKEYYVRGRPRDVDHVECMMKDALLVCEKEDIDDTLLLPLVILHDVGYAEVEKGDPFNLDLRRAHMKAGAEVARKLLGTVDYSADKIEKIVYYVSVHDNWAFGDSEVYKDIVLGTFTDLDFLWMATPKGFPALMEILHKSAKETFEYLDSKDDPAKGVPFSTDTTKKLYEDYLADRKKELNSTS